MNERTNLKIAVGTTLTITVPAAICMSILGPTEATFYAGSSITIIFTFLAAWMMGRGIPFDNGIMCGVVGAIAVAPGLLLALSYFAFGEVSWGARRLTAVCAAVAGIIVLVFLTLGINPLSTRTPPSSQAHP